MRLRLHWVWSFGLIVWSFSCQARAIKVAIVDDGFRLSHQSIKPYLYLHDADNPFDKIDNDQNGYLNDYRGWDVADMDNDVRPHKDITADFYHGTFIAGTICDMASQHLGPPNSELIKIIPIKAVSDTGDPNRILDGYAGIQYAIDIGADIIVTAWNGGEITSEQSRILKSALDQGILIIAAAGNEATDRPTPPASVDGVIAVSAIDQNGEKMYFSNYGQHIDFSTFGEGHQVPSASCDTCYMEGKNTSLAVALAAGLVSIIKAQHPEYSNEEINRIISASCDPHSNIEPKHRGLLGAGAINYDKAIAWAQDANQIRHNPLLPKGSISYQRSSSNTQSSFHIAPAAGVAETRLSIKELNEMDPNLKLFIKQNESLIATWGLNDLIDAPTISGSNIELFISSSANTEMILEYESIYIDSANYYCQELTNISEISGSISDGSGTKQYANESNCRWLIEVPIDEHIKIEFDEMDTEANTDMVYIFVGNKSLQTNLMAKFSGTSLPPRIEIPYHQCLIWFVSDAKNAGQGWKLHYRSTEGAK